MRIALLLLFVASTATASVTPSFPMLSKAQKVETAKTLAATFGKAAKAKVEVDDVGLIEHVELTLAAAVKDDDKIEAALALVRDHAAAFGVRDPKALHAKIQYSDVVIGEGARWTGGITVQIFKAQVNTRGHLWPIETPAPPAVDKDKLLKKFYGLDGSAPSRCDCRKEDLFKTDASSFDVHVGVAMICKDKVLTPRAAIVVTTHFRGNVKGLEDLPWLLDATSRERISDDFLFPDGGSGESYAQTWSTITAHATQACIYK